MIYRIGGKGYTVQEIAGITGGRRIAGDNARTAALPDGRIHAISTDSRDENPGGLFFAIRGERFDGHAFIGDAIAHGAACIITDHDHPFSGLADEVRCDDTVAALGALAQDYAASIAPVTVAVTGSVGKTTTKEFICSILAQKFHTHKTEGNFNNQIGLPLTLLTLTPDHSASVLEFGMSARGEIAYLSRLARPDIAVITNIGTSHLEYLGTRENIRDAKMEITCGQKPGAPLILNGDEPLLAGVPGAVYVAFDNEAADYRLQNLREKDGHMFFDLVRRKKGVMSGLEIPVPGRHCVLDAGFACAVADLLGLSEENIRAGLLAFHNTRLRQNIYDFRGVTVIEDCYNAAPESMKAALSVLQSRPHTGKTVAVLGEMRELGPDSGRLHREVGEYAAETGVDYLITVGGGAEMIAAGAAESGFDIDHICIFKDFNDADAIAAVLADTVKTGDVLLFKASRAVKLERIIDKYKL